MRIGCCVSPDQIEVIADAGFDFCELPARAVLPFAEETEALPALRAIAAQRIRPESFNVLVPAELPLAGPQANTERLRGYFQNAFRRMAQLGAAVVVLGSGAARRIPDGWPRERALDQLAEALSLAGEESARAGIALALEHLNRGECNVFTSLAECAEFVRQRGLRDVHLLADLYHIEVEHESLDAVRQAGSLIVHAHTAGGGRKAPQVPGYDHAGFARALRDAGYNARVSAENSWDDLAAQAPAALAFMRQVYA
jgi:sugar phosphate isomerase/epimerase